MKLRTFARGTKELRCDEEPWLLNGRRARPADDGCDQTNAGRHAPMDMPSAIVRYTTTDMTVSLGEFRAQDRWLAAERWSPSGRSPTAGSIAVPAALHYCDLVLTVQWRQVLGFRG